MRNALACLFRKALPVGLLWLLATPAPARDTNATWLARAWQSDEGLPNNTLTGLARTADGCLWLGTPSGLVRFDGIHFEDFAPTNFVAPPNRGVITMLRGRDGALWLAMDRGALVCLHGGSSREFVAGLPNLIPNGLAEDREGGLWIAYRGGTVYHLEGSKVTACTARDGLPEGSDICALTGDTKGRIWFAKAGQFGIVSNGLFHVVHRFDPAPARLAASRTGGLWLCSGFRLWKMEANGQFEDLGEFEPERGGTVATVLLEDHKGAVWIGTSYSGLFRYDESGFQTIQTSHQEISSLTEDHEGNLWVGTAGGGLNRIRRRAVALEDQRAGLPFAAVSSICEDATGTLWAATQNGALVRRVGGKWSPLPATTNWPVDAICVAADAQGCLWVGNRLHGLYCWRDGHFVSWNRPAELRTQTVHTLLISKGGDLWFGGENPPAIQRLRGGQLRMFPIPPDSRVIRAMAEDAAGNVWAGTSKGLLFHVTGDQLTEVTPRPSQELASIRCLYGSPDGALWIGYAGWGVGRLKDGHYAEIRTKQGLHDDYISHIIADDQGWLWFGANRGIFKVRQNELEALAESRSPRVRSIHYGRGEGLPSLQATFGASPGAARSRDGRLWLPMRTALAVVDPEQFGDSLNPPPTMLRRVLEDDRTVAWYGGVLPPMRGAVLDLKRRPGPTFPARRRAW